MLRQASYLQIPQTAGSLAFLSLFALAPVFSIVFWVTTASPVFARLRDALQGFLTGNLFPSSISETVISLLNQFAAKANELSVIGLSVFLLTAFVALQTIERTLNRIWVADRPRPLANRLALYWMLLTLGPLLLGAGLAFNARIVAAWLPGSELRELRGIWFVVLPWVTTTIGLTLLYRLLPSAPVRWREAFAGALLAAFLFEILRALLAGYVARLPTYTVVYGAFAALPLFLLWLFLGWMSLLLGALLAANLRFWGTPGEPHVERTPAARFADGYRVLEAMRAELGGGAYGAMPVSRVAEGLDHDTERAVAAALLLTQLGYITRFVTLGDATEGDASRAPATRRARLARSLSRRWSAPRPSADSVWDERWAWGDDPRVMSARALFEAVWHGGRPSGVDAVSIEVLDRPLVESEP